MIEIIFKYLLCDIWILLQHFSDSIMQYVLQLTFPIIVRTGSPWQYLSDVHLLHPIFTLYVTHQKIKVQLPVQPLVLVVGFTLK